MRKKSFFIVLLTLLNVSSLIAQQLCVGRFEELGSPHFGKFYSEHFKKPENTRQSSARRSSEMFEQTGLKYEFSSPGDSALKEKTVITFDGEVNPVMIVSFGWQDTDSSWNNQRKTIAWFTENNKRDKQYDFKWNRQHSIWEKQYGHEYTYSDSLDTYTCSYWEDSIQDWVNQCRLESYYNEKKENILSKSLAWEVALNEWNLYRYADYEYDEIGLKSYTSYEEDYPTGNFFPNSRTIRISETINPKVEEHYDWNLKLEDWILSNKYESHYDLSGELIKVMGYAYDSLLASFYLHYRREINGTDRMKSDMWFSMDITQEIMRGYKGITNYDVQGREIIQSWYEWDTLQQAFVIESKTFYSYDYNLVTDLTESTNDQVVLFPNPAGSTINISGIKPNQLVSIHAASGRKLFNRQLKESLLDLSGLKPGIYILTMKDYRNQPVKRKVVKY